jgi:hypothetical protein
MVIAGTDRTASRSGQALRSSSQAICRPRSGCRARHIVKACAADAHGLIVNGAELLDLSAFPGGGFGGRREPSPVVAVDLGRPVGFAGFLAINVAGRTNGTRTTPEPGSTLVIGINRWPFPAQDRLPEGNCLRAIAGKQLPRGKSFRNKIPRRYGIDIPPEAFNNLINTAVTPLIWPLPGAMCRNFVTAPLSYAAARATTPAPRLRAGPRPTRRRPQLDDQHRLPRPRPSTSAARSKSLSATAAKALPFPDLPAIP